MKISFFGINNLEKSIFVKRIFNIIRLDSENYKNIKAVQNNYFEDTFYQDEREFTLTNLPYSPLFKNNEEKFLSEELGKLNREKISESDHVVILFNLDHLATDEFLHLVQFIEKNSSSFSFVYFDSLDRNFFSEIFSFKNKKHYDISFYPLVRSRNEIKYFLEKELKIFGEAEYKKPENSAIKSVIIGPPNSGKSSLLNSIVGYERSLVSSTEGTTMEEVSSRFVYKNWNFDIFDTEGVLEKKSIYSFESIKKSDLVFIVIDVTKEITKNILQIADVSQRHDIPLVIVLNKVDLVGSDTVKEKENALRFRLKSFSFVPIISLSATKRINFNLLFEKIENIIAESKITISKRMVTSHANHLVESNQPPLIQGKRLKFYYGFHEKGFTHKIIFFVNEPKCVHFSYERYILNSFRRKMGIKHLPIKIFFKKS